MEQGQHIDAQRCGIVILCFIQGVKEDAAGIIADIIAEEVYEQKFISDKPDSDKAVSFRVDVNINNLISDEYWVNVDTNVYSPNQKNLEGFDQEFLVGALVSNIIEFLQTSGETALAANEEHMISL